MLLAIGCSNAATGVGWGGGCTGGLMATEGWGLATVGATARCGGGGATVGWGGGVNSGGIFINCPSHHIYKSPKQFELKQLKGSKST